MNLPQATWSAENAAILPFNVNFVSATLSPKRVTAQIRISKQLLKQTGQLPSLILSPASMTLDEYLAAKMKVAFASVLDQAALYGTGAANYQSLGVISTAGTNSVTTASPPIWSDLTCMRYLVTNYDANRDSFGWITDPRGRKYFEGTPRFTNAAARMWDLMEKEAEITLEVSDDRIFAGLWNYLIIAYWWFGDASGPAADIVVDPFSRAEYSEVIITGSAFVDVAVRWPQLFAYSQANIFP